MMDGLRQSGGFAVPETSLVAIRKQFVFRDFPEAVPLDELDAERCGRGCQAEQLAIVRAAPQAPGDAENAQPRPPSRARARRGS